MRIKNLLPSRRELLQFGGLGLLGASVNGIAPTFGATGSKVMPRGTARNILYYEISGAISHIESFDVKENAGSPKDLDFRKQREGLVLSHKLFPRLAKQIDKFAIARSLQSHEEVHFRGQYYVQTGRQMNLAFAKEIPAIGSVVAMELEQRRRPADTFPTYMSFYLEKGAAGALSTGFLEPRFSVVDINPDAAVKGNSLDRKAVELMEQRWKLLSQLRDANRRNAAGFAKEMAGYTDFYDTAHRLLTDSRWPDAFEVKKEDKDRYGNNPVGISAILARNVLAADAGTHYIHLCHPGWDHHVQIWDKAAKSNHYTLCAELDPALTSLMEDLSTMQSKYDPSKTLLDETLVVVMSEFGRTIGPLNNMAGRDHYNHCFPALFAGAGVKAGKFLGRTDSGGGKCLETGWNHKEQPRIENVVATMYSALGIDWSKQVTNTPSKRTYAYVDPLGAHGYIPTDELSELYT